MPSIIRTGNTHRVQFRFNGKRHTLSLGPVSRGDAEEFGRFLGRLISSRKLGVPPDGVTAAWVTGLPAETAARLSEVGLTDGRASVTVGDLYDYVQAELGGSPSTVKKRKNVGANLTEFLSRDRRLDSITPGDAEDFQRWLGRSGRRQADGEGLASATVSRRCATAKSWFAMAVRKGWLQKNPFEHIKRTSEANKSREHFVDRETIARFLDACPSSQFRLVIALARYGGLRCPSEMKPLLWEWLDWESRTLRVLAPKTKTIRTIPIYPELRPHLEQVWDEAAEGVPEILPALPSACSLTRRLGTLARKSKVVLWEKPWQNMRSTRQTELVSEFPRHVACAWIGNSDTVAQKHYLQVTKEHFAQASGAAPGPPELAGAAKALQS